MECTADYLRVNMMYHTVESPIRKRRKRPGELGPIVKLPAGAGTSFACVLLAHRTPSAAQYANEAAANASARKCKLDITSAISMVSLRLDRACRPFRSLGEGAGQCGMCHICSFLDCC
jgi:hypothetical protein